MAAKETSLVHPADAGATAAACRRAIERLGWDLLETGPDSGLRAEEPAAGLCCVVWPVTVEVGIEPESEERTVVTIRATIPGWGPIQSRQLRDRLGALEAAIGAAGKPAG